VSYTYFVTWKLTINPILGYEEAFVDLLHDTVKAALVEGGDKELSNDAIQRKEGWLHVHGKYTTMLTFQRS
jgi:hypothetical protein